MQEHVFNALFPASHAQLLTIVIAVLMGILLMEVYVIHVIIIAQLVSLQPIAQVVHLDII